MRIVQQPTEIVSTLQGSQEQLGISSFKNVRRIQEDVLIMLPPRGFTLDDMERILQEAHQSNPAFLEDARFTNNAFYCYTVEAMQQLLKHGFTFAGKKKMFNYTIWYKYSDLIK